MIKQTIFFELYNTSFVILLCGPLFAINYREFLDLLAIYNRVNHYSTNFTINEGKCDVLNADSRLLLTLRK